MSFVASDSWDVGQPVGMRGRGGLSSPARARSTQPSIPGRNRPVAFVAALGVHALLLLLVSMNQGEAAGGQRGGDVPSMMMFELADHPITTEITAPPQSAESAPDARPIVEKVAAAGVGVAEWKQARAVSSDADSASSAAAAVGGVAEPMAQNSGSGGDENFDPYAGAAPRRVPTVKTDANSAAKPVRCERSAIDRAGIAVSAFWVAERRPRKPLCD